MYGLFARESNRPHKTKDRDAYEESWNQDLWKAYNCPTAPLRTTKLVNVFSDDEALTFATQDQLYQLHYKIRHVRNMQQELAQIAGLAISADDLRSLNALTSGEADLTTVPGPTAA